MSHEIDYANWFFGGFKTIFAKVSNTGSLKIQAEDVAELLLTNRQGATVRIHLDFCRRDAVRRCTICGTNGTIVGDFIASRVTYMSASINHENTSNEFETKQMYSDQMKHFLNCVEFGGSPIVGATQGGQVLRIIDAARKSNSSGKNSLI